MNLAPLEALTFDDVLLVPAYSEVLPSMVSTRVTLSTRLHLETPLLSAAMDTITEAPMAIAMAREGGLGIIHKNLSISDQVAEVKKVKQASQAEVRSFPKASLDSQGRLLVGAAISVGEEGLIRAEALIDAGVDVLCLDSAHGHSRGVLDAIKKLKQKYQDRVLIMGGNVATPEGTLALIEAGADAVKVGVGPGSICTTRVVSGVGVPQLYAISECAKVAQQKNIPIIADGGIRLSGDLTKAFAAGASAVMIGSLLAGTDETPGEVLVEDGKSYKTYRGMGSLGAMAQSHGSKDRYFQSNVADAGKLVPEGIEGRVPYRGSTANNLHQLIGGLRSGMGYLGAESIYSLWKKAKFIRITNSGMSESHPHNIEITHSAPNYQNGKKE
jgi:IMP dehydrogenase